MAGVKKQQGTEQIHRKFYAQGMEWRPVKVSTKKIFGKGYKTFMSAQSIQTGELYKNSQGRIEPWDSISFSATKPKELNNGNS